MDKIEKIKDWVKKQKKEELARNSIGVITGHTFFVDANELLSFLDTLSEEPKSLEEAAEKHINEALFKWSYDDEDGIEQYVHDSFIAGAEWQKEQDMDEWIKDRDGCFWDGVNEGKKAMEEQMLKDAVEGTVNQDGILELSNGEAIDVCPSLDKCALGLQLCEKVKLIIVKDNDTE